MQLFVIPQTVACQAPLSMEFSRQEYWSVLPFPSPGNLPDPGIKPGSPALQGDSLPSSGKPITEYTLAIISTWLNSRTPFQSMLPFKYGPQKYLGILILSMEVKL